MTLWVDPKILDLVSTHHYPIYRWPGVTSVVLLGVIGNFGYNH